MKFVKSNLDPVMINLNGVEYPTRLTFRALAEIEEATGIGFMEMINQFLSEDGVAPSRVIDILYIILKHGGVELTKDDLLSEDYSVQT